MSERFSIIIPVYKVREYLEKCIDSVLAQTYTDYSLILVDDGCPEGCGAICDAYAYSNPEKISVIHQNNTGLGGARNAGLKSAEGEYILFVDSDDWIEPEMLGSLNNALENYDSPDMILFGHISDSEYGSWKSGDNLPPDTVLSSESHRTLMFTRVMAWTRLVRREIYLKNDIMFPVGVLYEDLYTIPKLILKSERIVYIDEFPYHYSIRPGSIMKSVNAEKMVDRAAAIDDLIKYFTKNGMYERYYDEICFLSLSHILCAAVTDVMSVSPKHESIHIISECVRKNFPDYNQNKYLPRLSKREQGQVKRIYENKITAVENSYKRRQSLKKILAKFAPGLVGRLES